MRPKVDRLRDPPPSGCFWQLPLLRPEVLQCHQVCQGQNPTESSTHDCQAVVFTFVGAECHQERAGPGWEDGADPLQGGGEVP